MPFLCPPVSRRKFLPLGLPGRSWHAVSLRSPTLAPPSWLLTVGCCLFRARSRYVSPSDTPSSSLHRHRPAHLPVAKYLTEGSFPDVTLHWCWFSASIETKEPPSLDISDGPLEHENSASRASCRLTPLLREWCPSLARRGVMMVGDTNDGLNHRSVGE